MTVPVELLEQPDEARDAEGSRAFQALADLTIEHDLLGWLAPKHPCDLAQFLLLFRDALPEQDKGRVASIMRGLKQFFSGRRLGDEAIVQALRSHILFLCVGKYLRRRLDGAQVKSHVEVALAGKRIPPSGPNLDYGCAEASSGTAEFHECKVSPSDLFEGADRAASKQLRLLLNAQKQLSSNGWDVVCCVPALLSTYRVQWVFRRAALGNEVIPYGFDLIPTLASARPGSAPDPPEALNAG